MLSNKEYWFWLCNINNFGLKKIEAILNLYHSPEEAFHENEMKLKEIKCISDDDIQIYRNSKDLSRIQDNYVKLLDKGIYFVTKDDKEYPGKLHNIYNSPYALYVKGSLPDNDSINIAIIGARDCSDYGREMASYLSMELSKVGLGIISGLARGIDGYAHYGALKTSGRTYGVLGCGVDMCYPKENFSLYMDIQENGGIISEYSLGTNPKAGNFPMRNRLISGMSDGIVVIEAKEKSGSLITVDIGLEQGKNIYALPGRVNDKLSTGCNNLIKIGAKLISEPADILEDFLLNYENSENDMKKNDKLLETDEKMVYARLSLLPKHVNEIAEETNIAIANLSEILINLQFKDCIKEVRKNYYSLKY